MTKEDGIIGGVVITRNDIEEHKRKILDQSMLVNLENAATILDCSTRTVSNRIRSGELSGYNRGPAGTKGVKLLAAELRDYVRSMRKDKDDWRK